MIVVMIVGVSMAVFRECNKLEENNRNQNGSLVQIASPDVRTLTMDNFLWKEISPSGSLPNSFGLLLITSPICWAKEDLVQFLKEYSAVELL
ncbi:hypothetical protein ACFX12_004151 [Malus domestica]